MAFSFKTDVMGRLWHLTKKGAYKGYEVFFGLWDVEPPAEKDRTEEGLAGAFIRKRKEKLESRERFWGRLLPADRRELAILKLEFASSAHRVSKGEAEDFVAARTISRFLWILYAPCVFYFTFSCVSYIMRIAAKY